MHSTPPTVTVPWRQPPTGRIFMAGLFEVFVDAESLIRFRLKAPDGTVLAVSKAFADKSAAVAGIADVRECAGTGLVSDRCNGGRVDPASSASAGQGEVTLRLPAREVSTRGRAISGASTRWAGAA
jgi:uncharacterized protein